MLKIFYMTQNVITNQFNEYFTNMSPNLSNIIKTLRNKSFDRYLSQKYIDMLLIIDKLAPKSSFGFDGISSKIIKMLKGTLTKLITLIINEC